MHSYLPNVCITIYRNRVFLFTENSVSLFTNFCALLFTDHNTPYKPFMCLPMSALLYATLKDSLKIDAKLATGNLTYRGEHIFKQDFSISEAKNNTLQDWAGHAWVEIEDLICDLSFFRTLYSVKFTKPFKQKLINDFGEGRGALIASRAEMNSLGLFIIFLKAAEIPCPIPLEL